MSNELFGTDGVRGKANTYPMDVGFALLLAKTLSKTVCLKQRKVAIGKDTRISGDMLEAALCAEFLANGVSVVLLGVVPTPLVTLKTPALGVDMSLMITASHNPYSDNGIKLINEKGDKFSDDFYAQLEQLIAKEKNNNDESPKEKPLGRIIRNEDVVEDYIQDMRQIAPSYNALQGLKVVIDCANGSYYYILPQTFKDLGAGVIVLNNHPDGYNINKNCGSQHTEELAKTVRESNAHFGIAVDGDGDRIILVDENGQLIDGDQLLCFLACYMKKNDQLYNDVVVSTEWSNLGLGNYLKQNGFKHYQSKVGERYVIDLMKETSATLGGELVGHIVLSPYAKSGDALATAIVLSLAYLSDGRKMSEIFPMFPAYPCIIENIYFSTKAYMQESIEYQDVKDALTESKALLGEDSNLIARKSGTEPVIKLRVEGKDASIVAEVAKKLKALILKHQK